MLTALIKEILSDTCCERYMLNALLVRLLLMSCGKVLVTLRRLFKWVAPSAGNISCP
jgi:hypothetical protein